MHLACSIGKSFTVCLVSAKRRERNVREKKSRREKEGTRKGKENMCLDANEKINLWNWIYFTLLLF